MCQQELAHLETSPASLPWDRQDWRGPLAVVFVCPASLDKETLATAREHTLVLELNLDPDQEISVSTNLNERPHLFGERESGMQVLASTWNESSLV